MAAFTGWLDDFFAVYYRHRPVNATFAGVHDHDDRLPDYSSRGVDEAVAAMDALLAWLRNLPREPLSESEETDRRLAEGFLAIQRWEFESSHFHRGNPCVYTGEAIFGVIGLFLRPFAPLAERAEHAAARLSAVPALLDQGRRHLREAPAAWIDRAVRECTGAHRLLGEGIDLLLRDAGLAHPGLRAAAARASAAFAEFGHYLETDLRARATEGYACGGDALDLLLRHGHCLDENADQIAAYAEEQIASCESALAAGAGTFGARTPQEALGQLLDRHPSAEEYYARYADVWRRAREAALAHDLVTWPDHPLRYVPQPVWARGAAPFLYFLSYRSPAPFDRAPVVDYLVSPIEPEMPPAEQTRRLRAANDSVIKLNHVIHHGGLGHHVQNWNAYRAPSRIGQVAAVDCASRIAMFCGGTMAEGWACYATDLMDEIGFLEPLERYAQRHARLRQAARALVDVRLHQGAFSLDDAVACYRDRVGMTAEGARAEAVKNSMFPGAALMYLVGTDAIHALRRALSSRPGFTLRGFHDRFLSYGSIPVALIRERMLRAEDTRRGDGTG
ncbi:MAG TPA: DUF885 family protein [bacterium]|nr:DUF885 family protein [bacterium]